jgi:hypothetical protein
VPGTAPGGQQDPFVRAFAAVRRYPLESAAIALLVAGALIYPFPLWLFGVAAIVISRLWDTRDKLGALAVPVITLLLGAMVVAGIVGKPGSLAGYADVLGGDGWNLIRFGVVLGAVYLGWRLRQGRRPERQPPWRRPRQEPPWRRAPHV